MRNNNFTYLITITLSFVFFIIISVILRLNFDYRNNVIFYIGSSYIFLIPYTAYLYKKLINDASFNSNNKIIVRLSFYFSNIVLLSFSIISGMKLLEVPKGELTFFTLVSPLIAYLITFCFTHILHGNFIKNSWNGLITYSTAVNLIVFHFVIKLILISYLYNNVSLKQTTWELYYKDLTANFLMIPYTIIIIVSVFRFFKNLSTPDNLKITREKKLFLQMLFGIWIINQIYDFLPYSNLLKQKYFS